MKYLKKCLDSILADLENYETWEREQERMCGREQGHDHKAGLPDESKAKEYTHPIIIVDNGSVDGSRELAKSYAQVKVIALEENKGFCSAVNIGIQVADTPYVILLNNDLTIEKGFFRALEDAMDKNPKAFSAGAQMRMMKAPDHIDNAGTYYCALGWAYDYGKGKKISPKYLKPGKIFAACGGAAIYRKSILERIGLFDEKHFAYLEDVDIGYRARIYGYQNLYVPDALAYHAGSSVSGSKYNEFKTNLSSANSIYIIEKNMPSLQILLNFPFLLVGFLIKILFFCKKGLGKNYVRGLIRGFWIYYREGGRKNHVPFQIKNFGNYILIQLELWINILRRL